MELLQQNANLMDVEFQWFSKVVQARFTSYFQQEGTAASIHDIPPPKLDEHAGPYASFLTTLHAVLADNFSGTKQELAEWQNAHRLVILLALAPHVRPGALDIFFTKNSLYDRGFTEFGGLSGKQHGGFLPTGETVMFLLAGKDLTRRHLLLQLFAEDHYFYTANVLELGRQQEGEPFLSGALNLSEEYLTLFTTGATFQPHYSGKFPARRLHTQLTWDDLALPPLLRHQIEEINTWLEHERLILEEWGLGNKLKPGFRTLFHGPPGTGKTLCATLLGQQSNRPVYRIDLSQVVSKYIGETEKNLSRLFDQAENRDWVLFFDEADALFGKRTATRGANDRYANQEVAYLLQRIESYNGLVILATNLKGNIDEAFSRRFQSMLYFSIPDAEQRLRLWQQTFGTALPLADNIDLEQLARDYEISGGGMVNVVRYCAIAALQRGDRVVQRQDVLAGVRREFRKEGKTV